MTTPVRPSKSAAPSEPRAPTALDNFLFDLRGYLVIENAVTPALLDDLNRAQARLSVPPKLGARG